MVERRLTTEQIIERDKEIRVRLTAEYFTQELRRALQDPAYITGELRFNWERFALDLFPDLDPPFKAWELFYHMRGRFVPPETRSVPRSRIWWAVRVIITAKDPDEWLLAQREAGRSWVSVAGELGCGLTNVALSAYASRVRARRQGRVEVKAEATRIEGDEARTDSSQPCV